MLHAIHVSEQTYFIQAQFNDDGSCNALVTNCEKAWKCTVDGATIKKFAKETSIELKEYLEYMKSALCGASHTQSFHYSVHEKNEKLQLEWKKVQKDVKFCLGSIELKQVQEPYSAVKSILTACCSSLKSFNTSLETSKESFTKLEKQYFDLVVDLDACVKLKESLETDLLSKFVLVLNEKKAKIRSLKKQLLNCASGDKNNVLLKQENPEVQKTTRNDATTKSKPRKMDLDDSLDAEPVLPKRKRLPAKPITISVSPVKTKMPTPVSPAKFPSDINATTSCDSTVDINELLDDV